MIAVEVLAGRRAGVGAAAVRGQVAVVDLPDVPGRTTLPAALLPGRLAGLVELGPRPRPAVTGSLVLGREAMDEVLAGCGLAPAVPAQWQDALGGSRDDLVTQWRLSHIATRGDAGLRAASVLEVLDLGRRGLWRLGTADEAWLAAELADEPAPDGPVMVSATTATAVWAALSTA